MAGNYILQWNCNGLRGHRVELELIISKYAPSVVCLHETMLTPGIENYMTFKGYKTYYKSNINGHGGVGILVKNTIPQSPVNINTNLQARAVCVTIKRKAYNICSIYTPPRSNPPLLDFQNIINQFSKPYVLCGDFNAHSPFWTSSQSNDHGKIIEDLLDEYGLVPLNTTVHTFNKPPFAPSLIDLTLVHPSIYLDFNNSVIENQYHSDHHPILISVNEDEEPDTEKNAQMELQKS